jgi:hypothetical protein
VAQQFGSSILKAAQRELSRHSWEYFVDNPPSIAQGGKGVVVSGCPACKRLISTPHGFIELLANDVLPGILETAVSTATKFVYCRNCEAVVEYEKSLLESDRRNGLEIVCVNCHFVICTFHDSKPAEAVESAPDKATSACPKCGMSLRCGIDSFDTVDALRCPHCDALFEHGRFVCYGAKPQAHQN